MSIRKHVLHVLLAFTAVFALAAVASAQTVDEVIEKHLAALGGREALGKITNRHATGSVTVSTPGGDISGPIEIFAKAPNKARAYMTLDLSAMGGQEMIIEQRFDGTKGFSFNSMQGETEITGNQLENMKNGLFPSALLQYKEAGFKAELLPKEKVGDKEMIVLRLTPKAGSAVRLFLDPQTYLVARTVATINVPQAGGDIEQVSDLSDYRVVDGVKVPFQTVQSNSMQSLTIVLKAVEHNVAMDDAIFGKK